MAQADQPEISQAGYWAAIFVLCFADAVAAIFCRLPSIRFFSWSELWSAALVRMLTVALASMAAGWAFYAFNPALREPGSRRLMLETLLNTFWLAPLALFIRENSLWAIAIAAMVAVLVTQSMRGFQRWLPNPGESLLFSLRPDSLPLCFKHAPQISIAAALSLQAGIIGAFAGHSFAAVLLVGIAFAAWTWSYTHSALVFRWPRSPSSLEARSLMLATLAFLFVIGALFPYLQTSHGYGRFGISVGNHGWLAGAAGHHRGQPIHVTNPDKSALTASAGDTGIVLLPVNQTVTKLVAPTPMQLKSVLTSGRASDPLIIPFNGVYWFFKAPDVQPPKTSRQARASPETVDIRSTDRRPLSIEAHDYLGNLIDLNCCSRIQIAIRNADRYPETVFLELVLVNTTLPSRPSESLGRIMVKSTRPWDIYGKPATESETLDFSIPLRPALQRFDEVRIVFRLDRSRADAGAKIAIDHFVLVPRGL